MRHLFAALAITALLGGSAFAVTITVDGNFSDWPANLILEDPVGDNPGESGSEYLGAVDIHRYGVTVIDGYLYGFVQLTEPLTTYTSGTRGFDRGPSIGFWIDADQNAATGLNDISSDTPVLFGTDIMVEVFGVRGSPIGVEYYGADDSLDNEITAYYNDGSADAINDSYVIEWSAPISSIKAALAGLPDNVDSSGSWNVYLAGEGRIKNADGSTALSWGRDVAGPITVVPEPGTLALLASAGMALALLGVRRLRRK